MTTLEVLLNGREEIAERTMAFHFQKHAGFKFQPGQAIDLILASPQSTDAAIVCHTFSLVSAPFQELVTIATRMRESAFKRALAALRIGAAAKLEGLFGSLTLHSSRARPAVFIAGGIGITPIMRILREAAHERLT